MRQSDRIDVVFGLCFLPSRNEGFEMKADKGKSEPALVSDEKRLESLSCGAARAGKFKTSPDAAARIFRYLFRKPDTQKEGTR